MGAIVKSHGQQLLNRSDLRDEIHVEIDPIDDAALAAMA
jgi:hypothetical protein